MRESVNSHAKKTSAAHQQQFPKTPDSPCGAEWEHWAQSVTAELGRTTAEQRHAQKMHDQQNADIKRKKVQGGYMQNQKKTHKSILGKGSQHTLGAVRDADTRELHTDPEKIKQNVQNFHQHQADPATHAG